jgi:hypothetical protein
METEVKAKVKLTNVLMVFADIFEVSKFNPENPKYGATFNLGNVKGPNAELIKEIKNVVAAAARDKWPKRELKETLAEVRLPFKYGKIVNKKRKYDSVEDDDFIVVSTANSDHPPALVDRQVKPITSREELYAGCTVNAVLTPYAYDNKSEGILFNLVSIQLVKQGKKLGGGASRPEEDYTTLEDTVATGKDAGAMFGQAEADEDDDMYS